jgi:hypothetical protein
MSPTNVHKPESGKPRLPPWLGRWLCRLGLHDFRVVDVSFGFGPGETIEHVRCRRCDALGLRQGRR